MKTRFRQILWLLLLVIFSDALSAQNNTNSPYTRYGYGALADPISSNSRAMGGMGIGLRDRLHVNISNPASYTAMDSLTFLFDGGVTLQNTNFSDGTYKLNAKNTSVNYFAMQFRLNKKAAMSLGLTPFSFVGYNLSQTYDDPTSADNYSSLNFYGDGGLHQLYGGIAINFIKNLSIGATFSYIWGDITHRAVQTFPRNPSALGVTNLENVDVRSFKFDFGMQYVHRINSRNTLVIGAVYTPKQKLSNDASLTTALGVSGSYTEVSTVNDTIVTCEIPNSYGLGFSYVYDQRWTVGMDVLYQQWSKVKFMNGKDLFCDRMKVSAGVEYMPALYGNNFLKLVKYRAGAYYSLPYYKLDGKRAAREYGASIGFGLPVPRSNSIINVSGQFAHLQGIGASRLDENIFQVTVGLTFNETWFFKRRIN